MEHEGKKLQSWLESEGLSPEELGKVLNVKKQTVYYHIGREIVGDSFKKKMQVLKSNPFDGNIRKDSEDSDLKDRLVQALTDLNDVRKDLREAENKIRYLENELRLSPKKNTA